MLPALSICNGSSTNCSRSQLLLPSFSTASAIRVLLTLAMAGISSSLNVYVLLGALRARRSHIRTLLVNLCGADLLVTALVMPMDACWNYTVQWAAGAAACRLLMFLKLFAMYSCALVTLVISLDRYCAVVRPLSIGLAARRNRAMLAAAWMSSGVLAAPQVQCGPGDGGLHSGGSGCLSSGRATCTGPLGARSCVEVVSLRDLNAGEDCPYQSLPLRES